MLTHTWRKQVYLPEIQGYVPEKMVKTLQAFLDFCYIVQCDVHNTQSLKALEDALDHFHKHCKIFWTSGVHMNGFNLPRSHAVVHYLCLIQAFSTPDGLCSSITESKHIKVVKEPWHQSGHWNVLQQMLTTNSHLDKLAAAWVDFASCGMLEGTILESVLNQLSEFRSKLHSVSIPDVFDLISRCLITWQWPTSPMSCTCFSCW